MRFEPLSDADRAHLESFITRTRKEDHLRICLGEGVSFREVTNGFERWRIPHRALPEVDLDTVELGTTFLGRRLSLPLLISSMTGGSDLARRINQNLARAAQARGVAIGLGSMRILLADESALDTFAVRDLAPDVPLYANLGAVQLNYGAGAPECEKLVRLVGADGLILHLNPLQEAVQPEGDARFAGLARRIADVVPNLPFPVIAKEVGAGISAEVARELVRAGVRAIDVAGASGTSWSRIEGKRARSERAARLGELFGDWGIPTAECLLDCRQALPEVPLVASGGIRNGLEAAKAIAMGADLVGIARPFLEAANDSAEAAIQRIDEFARELRVAMFAAGARNLAELGRVRLVRTGGP
ncbi:MAG: type 2 isopentenyl-diphosphate Delta-isomerase [Planctomycetes bacterium]|nr:type 2 isopentenyl-diphosphate Delta-isomerase [Planctomycetota bacterium]